MPPSNGSRRSTVPGRWLQSNHPEQAGIDASFIDWFVRNGHAVVCLSSLMTLLHSHILICVSVYREHDCFEFLGPPASDPGRK